MSNTVEVAITSEESGQLWNACVWDPSVGTSLMTYKGGGMASPRSLCVLGKDYLIAADYTKPLLHAWQLNSQQPVSAKGVRLVCPGRVHSLAISPNGCYCVMAVAEKLHIWQIASGRQLAVAVRHYQQVNCIRFTDDGSHFVSGGEDGLVLVWSLPYLISSHGGEVISGNTEPRYTFTDHSLPVKDLYVGPGGMRARLISVSLDKTCKLYDLASGTPLLSVVFDSILTAVTMDTSEKEVFVGSLNSNIYQFSLQSPPRTLEYHPTEEQMKGKVFSGHTKAITCLSVSMDGLTLMSGSLDKQVMLWYIPSRQCIRILNHKGPVTNAFFAIAPKNMFAEETKPSIILCSFQRSNNQFGETPVLSIRTTHDDWYTREDVPESDTGKLNNYSVNATYAPDNGLTEQIVTLKTINQDLYTFAVEKILQPFNEIKVDSMTLINPESSCPRKIEKIKTKSKPKNKLMVSKTKLMVSKTKNFKRKKVNERKKVTYKKSKKERRA